jgi:hypothetical protein
LTEEDRQALRAIIEGPDIEGPHQSVAHDQSGPDTPALRSTFRQTRTARGHSRS